MRLHTAVTTLFFSLTVLYYPAPAVADMPTDTRVVIYNESPYTVSRAYMSPPGNPDWGPNLLPENITPFGRVTIDPAEWAPGYCEYEWTVEMIGGYTAWGLIDACDIDAHITLYDEDE